MVCKSKYMQVCTLCIIGSLWLSECVAQEITPRLFWPTPKGTEVLVAGYSYSTGEVLFAPSLPIEDSESTVNTGLLGYTRTLNLWGRTANILFDVPYSKGSSDGLVEGTYEETDFSALGDLSVTLNLNLRGAPTMNKEEFLAFRANPRPIIGISLKVKAPTGQYSPNRLVNVGANRWSSRLKLGAVNILSKAWLLETSASVWVFGDDEDYIMGNRQQDPVFSAEANLIKRMRPGLWASLDLTYFRGGRLTVDGEPLKNPQNNLKLGGTLVVPFLQRHAIKIGYATGIVTKFGENFDQFLISYQVVVK